MPASVFVYFFNDTATTEIYTLSLHDALPICIFRNECAPSRAALQNVLAQQPRDSLPNRLPGDAELLRQHALGGKPLALGVLTRFDLPHEEVVQLLANRNGAIGIDHTNPYSNRRQSRRRPRDSHLAMGLPMDLTYFAILKIQSLER